MITYRGNRIVSGNVIASPLLKLRIISITAIALIGPRLRWRISPTVRLAGFIVTLLARAHNSALAPHATGHEAAARS